MPKAERDKKIRQLVSSLFEEAKRSMPVLSEKQDRLFGTLFSVKARGFREILLVIVVAKLMDPSYSASKKFYACNPRAIYEGPIKSELASRKIPRGKSGPLNVAKATIGIDETWAAQRRPKAAADAVVQLVKDLEKMDKKDLHVFAVKLHRKFLDEASRIAKLAYRPKSDISRGGLIGLVIELIRNTPDLGNTPQKICAEILKQKNAAYGLNIEVLGAEDRACTTSTTSKKPGDITELYGPGKEPLRVFEVSVKVVDEQRLEDCVESVMDYSEKTRHEIREVFFLCRPEDIKLASFKPRDTVFFGTYTLGGIDFHFVDLFKWITNEIATMPAAAFANFFSAIKEYVASENTSEAVKGFWSKWFSGRAASP